MVNSQPLCHGGSWITWVYQSVTHWILRVTRRHLSWWSPALCLHSIKIQLSPPPMTWQALTFCGGSRRAAGDRLVSRWNFLSPNVPPPSSSSLSSTDDCPSPATLVLHLLVILYIRPHPSALLCCFLPAWRASAFRLQIGDRKTLDPPGAQQAPVWNNFSA